MGANNGVQLSTRQHFCVYHQRGKFFETRQVFKDSLWVVVVYVFFCPAWGSFLIRLSPGLKAHSPFLFRDGLQISRRETAGAALSVPWSLQPRNRTAAATCGRGRCELPAMLRANRQNRWRSRFFLQPVKRKTHRVLPEGAPEGATALLHFCKCSRPFIRSVKSTLSYLKNCNPVGGYPVKRRLKKPLRFLQRECFGGRHRGAQFCFIFATLRTLLSCSTMRLLDLKTCTPMKGTPWSTAWEWLRARSRPPWSLRFWQIAMRALCH